MTNARFNNLRFSLLPTHPERAVTEKQSVEFHKQTLRTGGTGYKRGLDAKPPKRSCGTYVRKSVTDLNSSLKYGRVKKKNTGGFCFLRAA